jgi:hypothetical protein
MVGQHQLQASSSHQDRRGVQIKGGKITCHSATKATIADGRPAEQCKQRDVQRAMYRGWTWLESKSMHQCRPTYDTPAVLLYAETVLLAPNL